MSLCSEINQCFFKLFIHSKKVYHAFSKRYLRFTLLLINFQLTVANTIHLYLLCTQVFLHDAILVLFMSDVVQHTAHPLAE